MKKFFFMLVVAASLAAADATGKWTGSLTSVSPDGQERSGPALLELTQEGSKLTGTVGPDAGERHPIEDGKAEDGVITFEVRRESIMKFSLKQQGDELKGDITRERNGQTMRAKLEVKREK